MASATKQVWTIRKRKLTTQGKKRKRQIRAHGTTPVFPIHLPHVADTSSSEGSK